MSDTGLILTVVFLAIVYFGLRSSRGHSHHQMPNKGKKHGGQPFSQKKKGQHQPMPPFSREHGKQMPSRPQRPLPDDDDEDDDVELLKLMRRNARMNAGNRSRRDLDDDDE